MDPISNNRDQNKNKSYIEAYSERAILSRETYTVKPGETLVGIVNTKAGDSYEQTVEAARASGVELLDVDHWAARFNTNADAIIAKMQANGQTYRKNMEFVDLKPGDIVTVVRDGKGVKEVRVAKLGK